MYDLILHLINLNDNNMKSYEIISYDKTGIKNKKLYRGKNFEFYTISILLVLLTQQ